MQLLNILTVTTFVGVVVGFGSNELTQSNNSVCHIINLPSGGRVRIETHVLCGGEDTNPAYIQCPLHSYEFPRAKQTSDMIRVKTPIPDIENGTLCTWVTVNQHETFQGTLMSYSVGKLLNALVVFTEATDRAQVRVFVSPMGRLIDAPMKNNLSHLCVSFSTADGRVKIYIDGQKIKQEKKFTGTAMLQGGGIMIVGQEQDEGIGRAFDREQAFKGTITNYMFWQRELTSGEISDIAQKCICPNDYLFNLNPQDVTVHGEVTAIDVGKCPTRPAMLEAQ